MHRDFIALINSPGHEDSANTKISLIWDLDIITPPKYTECPGQDWARVQIKNYKLGVYMLPKKLVEEVAISHVGQNCQQTNIQACLMP